MKDDNINLVGNPKVTSEHLDDINANDNISRPSPSIPIKSPISDIQIHSNSNSKKVYCCTRKYKSQFTNADIKSYLVHGNGGKHAVCTFFICAHMLLPITFLLKNTDITQRIVCHAQQWGQRNPSGLMGPRSDTFNQVICSVHKGQSGKISQ